jgi:hypothetical protein
MRVDNRVTEVPPLKTREADHEATSRSPADTAPKLFYLLTSCGTRW